MLQILCLQITMWSTPINYYLEIKILIIQQGKILLMFEMCLHTVLTVTFVCVGL